MGSGRRAETPAADHKVDEDEGHDSGGHLVEGVGKEEPEPAPKQEFEVRPDKEGDEDGA